MVDSFSCGSGKREAPRRDVHCAFASDDLAFVRVLLTSGALRFRKSMFHYFPDICGKNV